MSLLKLLPMPPAEIVEGRALFENQDLIQMDLNQLRKIRGGKIGFIFQDPMTSLNPVLTVGYQLMEPMREHLGLSREEARKKAIELLDLVGIPMAQSRLKDFPHQFSGGMRQRVMIAIALACDPKVLIADEPTTALDVRFWLRYWISSKDCVKNSEWPSFGSSMTLDSWRGLRTTLLLCMGGLSGNRLL